MIETRIYLLTNDLSENYFTGRIVRTEDQILPELWNLKVGDSLPAKENPHITFMREK